MQGQEVKRPVRPPKLGYSKPSKQIRQGPAPLASFEDLPSDDQISISSDTPVNDLSPDVEFLNAQLERDSGDLLRGGGECRLSADTDENRRSSGTSTATVTPTNLNVGTFGDEGDDAIRRKSTPGGRREAERDSNELKSPYIEKRRKSSWTDVLFHRGRSKSSIDVETMKKAKGAKSPNNKKGVFDFFKKKRKDSSTAMEQLAVGEMNHQPEGRNRKFLLPRVEVNDMYDRSPGTSPAPPPPSIADISPGDGDSMINWVNFSSSPFSPRHVPSSLISPTQQSETETTTPSSVDPIILLSRRKLKKRDTMDSDISECQSLPGCLPSTRKAIWKESEAPTPDVDVEEGEEDYESSASECLSVVENKKYLSQGLVDETEAANLLSHDHDESIEGDEHLLPTAICDPHHQRSSSLVPPSTEQLDNNASASANTSRKSSVIQILSKKERQELSTTNPVDRPRSTTPVAIAPLEEYLRRASLKSPEVPGTPSSVEKIKLSLPGEQFTSNGVRLKGPRTSNPQIWLDFCEKSLVSPKTKKAMNWKDIERETSGESGDQLQLPSGSQNVLTVAAALSPNDAFTPVSDALTPVTPLDDLSMAYMFADSFDPTSSSMKRTFRLPSECDQCICRHRGKGMFAASSHGSSVDPDSPLVENLNDPNAQENQVLIPPKAVKEFNPEEEGEAEDEPLMSPNACQCECHRFLFLRSQQHQHHQSTVGATADTVNVMLAMKKQDSILSASSEVSSASSRVLDFSPAETPGT